MNASKKIALVFGLAWALSTETAAAARPNVKPGLWEITTKMDMPGMPMAMPPTTRTQCYTKEDVKDAKNIAPTSFRKSETCALKEYKLKGNRMTWSVECNDKGSTKGTGEMVLNGDSYEGTVKLTGSDPRRGEMQMTQHITGKRVGDCK